MSEFLERVSVQLCPPLSSVDFEQLIQALSKSAGAPRDELGPSHVDFLVGYVKPKLAHTLGPAQAAARIEAIRRLDVATEPAAPPPVVYLSVRSEAHLPVARQRVQALLAAANARSFATNRAVTAVSELTRNALMYAKGGTLDARLEGRTLVVVVRDAGPGIADLPLVLSGNYRSRTGLGLGLLGVKRLADRFDLVTGAGGTTVEAAFRL